MYIYKYYKYRCIYIIYYKDMHYIPESSRIYTQHLVLRVCHRCDPMIPFSSSLHGHDCSPSKLVSKLDQLSQARRGLAWKDKDSDFWTQKEAGSAFGISYSRRTLKSKLTQWDHQVKNLRNVIQNQRRKFEALLIKEPKGIVVKGLMWKTPFSPLHLHLCWTESSF